MRSLAFIFLSLALSVHTLVRGEVYLVDVIFKESAPVLYTADDNATKLGIGEAFQAFFVRDTRADKTPPPCTIDVIGQIVPATGLTLADFKWCTFRVPASSSTYQEQGWTKVITEYGIPASKTSENGGYHRVTVFTEERFNPTASIESNVYLYLVALDTRNADGECEEDLTQSAAPVRPCRYSLVKCCSVGGATVGGGSKTVAVGYTDSSADAVVCLAGQTLSGVTAAGWEEAVAPVALVVDNQELAGEALEAYLTPEVTGFSTTEPAAVSAASLLTAEADSSATFYLSASSPDLCFYALETKESLNDAAWKPFNDLLTEKGVDNASQKDYTRCRIDGRSPLTIPVFSGETGRFYRLRMVNQ